MAMNDKERESLREALLAGLEPSGELKEKFETQVEAIVHPRLSQRARIVRRVLAFVFLLNAPVFAWGAYSFATSDAKLLVRVFGSVTFGLGTLPWLWAAFHAAKQARSGLSPGRRLQKAIIFVPYSVVLLYSCITLMLMSTLELPATSMIAITAGMLFFWIMAWGLVLQATAGWHREDILLEQKRTQLGVALVAEQLRGRGQSLSVK